MQDSYTEYIGDKMRVGLARKRKPFKRIVIEFDEEDSDVEISNSEPSQEPIQSLPEPPVVQEESPQDPPLPEGEERPSSDRAEVPLEECLTDQHEEPAAEERAEEAVQMPEVIERDDCDPPLEEAQPLSHSRKSRSRRYQRPVVERESVRESPFDIFINMIMSQTASWEVKPKDGVELVAKSEMEFQILRAARKAAQVDEAKKRDRLTKVIINGGKTKWYKK
jgi:hypothetical protein